MPSLDRALVLAALLSLAASLAAVAAFAIDDRLILGLNPWVKPWKFAVSIGVYLLTLAWMLPRVRIAPLTRAALRWTFIATMVGELVLIAMQSYRGTTSHFNEALPFDAAVFSTMGFLIMVNTVAAALLLVFFLRSPLPMPRAVLSGVRLGLLLFLAASAVGGMMVSNNGHAVGVADGGPGLPIVNWSTEGGDLRIAHFLGLHALQGLPLLGWVMSRRSPDAGLTVVRAAAAIWAAVFAWLLSEALAGRSLI